MADQDADKKPLYDSELPSDEALDEEPEESEESTGAEDEEFEGDAAAVAAATSGSRRFGFGRGRREEETTGQHSGQHMGSVRETHERVQIDDRPSAIYALLCAGALLGVLAIALIGNVLPTPTGPQLPPLVVPTSQATPVSSASASVSATPAPTATPVASATPAPTASPVASPVASPSN
jgi:hypothetical protein